MTTDGATDSKPVSVASLPGAPMPLGAMTPVSRRVMNLAHFLTRNARRFPERTGFVRGERRWTWAEIDAAGPDHVGGIDAGHKISILAALAFGCAPDFAAAEMLYIDPDTCIDCGLCVDECPVKAIFPEEDLPAEWASFVEKNKEYYKK